MPDLIENINIKNQQKIDKQGFDKPNSEKRELQIREKAREMESIFLTQMIKAMRKTIPDNSWSGSKNDLPSMMFSSTMGKALAKSGGIGLSEKIYKSLQKMDEKDIQQLEKEELDDSSLEINTWDFISNNPIELNNE
jgi:Rod binding domain-containing protein